MSETKKPSSLKKLTSGSTWVSPFRNAGGEKKNLRQQLTEENSIKKIGVPKKFLSHPTLEAEKKKKEEEAAAAKAKEEEAAKAAEAEAADEAEGDKAEAEAEVDADAEETVDAPEETEKPAEPASETITSNTSVKSLKDESINTPAEPVDAAETEVVANGTKEETAEEPAKEVAEETAETTEAAGDDNIVEQVKTSPIEIVTQPEFKYAPTEPVNEKTLEDFNDKPLLLARYNELNAAAVGSVSRSIDDPHKVIDLGSGLKMTQQQLLDIAALRVAPVLANINDEVSKTRSEDEIKRQQDLSTKVAGHEKKLQGDFDKHVKKIGKQREKFDKEIEERKNDLSRIMINADKTAEAFSTLTKGEIETANKEFEERETAAVEKHGSDKETLLKNHDELEATKKQELEDSKTNQEKTTTEIEELQEKKNKLDDENSDLSSKIEELTAKYNAKFEALEALKGTHSEKEASITKNLSTKGEIEQKLATTKADLETKKSKHSGLAAEVGLLTGAVAAYAAKLASLKSEKEQVPSRLSKAKENYNSWLSERQEVAKNVALDHERQRALAKEEEETKRIKAQEEAETKRIELELERQRLKEEEEFRAEEARVAAEKKAEEDRIAAEKKAEEDKIAAEKKAEEDKIAAEKALKDEEEEKARLKLQPEYQRQQRADAREAEKQRLYEERAEKERIYQERKQKEQDEADQLERDIAALYQQKDLKAQEAREEAERLAQEKLDEIEKLKAEHEERLKLFQERLDFEELQKTRLLEEVENLKKIRELREEKAKLALEVNRDDRLDDIQKLIRDRENEVAKLSKQIELDDQELYREHKKEALNLSSFIPVPQIRAAANSPVTALEKKEKASKESTSNGIKSTTAGAAAVTAAAVGGVSATAATPKTATTSSSGLETKPRSGSITKSIKRLSQKFKAPSSPTKKEAPKKEVSKEEAPSEKPAVISPKESIDLKKQPPATLKTQASRSEDASIVVYEEVSDSEYERNKDHPDYLEISHDEYEKSQQALAKAKNSEK